MPALATRGFGDAGVLASGGFGGGAVVDPGPARRRRMRAALATGVRRNLGYLLILIVGALT